MNLLRKLLKQLRALLPKLRIVWVRTLGIVRAGR